MRIIARSTLRKFWEIHADAERPLVEWYAMASKASWGNPAALKQDIRSASILKNRRAVFNIAGNKYRLVADIDYARQLLWVKFIGTHSDYDKIDVETV
jgi:mRNA interferase HigB